MSKLLDLQDRDEPLSVEVMEMNLMIGLIQTAVNSLRDRVVEALAVRVSKDDRDGHGAILLTPTVVYYMLETPHAKSALFGTISKKSPQIY